ncbi:MULTISPECIES: MFS transporter [unclassified Streptomyces]|uniref:MFS transporter n=1 Tax=unclassified Streptomyces TaxID=2593676 RepID=UPI0004536C7D|nr:MULTISPECIES: aromatic acid/H+ symport family MFS transporter [unclassified Streptomyces]EXU63679.1 major facilitator transporter [Streptomyces sp. PRh5]TMU98287.1 aromatic acid/H+ symport family MFS transporter [Streptomyces sp. DASNCL29]
MRKATPTNTPLNSSTPGLWPTVLCWIAVALDGFDLVVLGVVIPTLSKTRDLGFTDASLTTASTLGLVGVSLGAVATGPLTDRWGRRRTLLGSIALFSVATLADGFAPTMTAFIILRFVAGVGLGACLPTSLAFISEHARDGKNATAVTTAMTGNHAGAVLTALLGLVLVPELGWRSMFVAGGLLGIALLPLLWAKLPESETYIAADRQRETSPAPVRQYRADVVRGANLITSLALWAASFMGLLLVFGLNTWLPRIMGQAGYSIQAGTGLLLILNIGAVIGLIVAGRVSDHTGHKTTTLMWFALAATLLALLSIRLQSQVLVFSAVLVTGVFVFSAQVLVYAWTTQLYPPELRATALGLTAGIGRLGAILGPYLLGTLVTAGIAYPWGFYALACAAAIAALALSPISVHRKPTVHE